MEAKFVEIFKETVEMEDAAIDVDTKFRELENWDSLTFLSVLAMLDEEYDVIIEGNDFRKLETLGDLLNEIKKNG